MEQTYTGVDIGDSSIKLAVSDGQSVSKVAIEMLPEGLVADGRIVSHDAMADFIKSVVRSIGGVSKDVAFVVPSSDSLFRRLSLPAMTEKELRLNLPYEFRDYISQGKDRYVYDYAMLGMRNIADGQPEGMDLLAVAAPKQAIADYTEMFRRAGLKLKVALPEQAAYQNLVGGNPRALANCCVIDFSHHMTKLHFFLDGAYDVARVIEIGGIDIDRAIANEYGVDEALPTSTSAPTTRAQPSRPPARCTSPSRLKSGALNFYGFNNPDAVIEVAYCCGGGLLDPLVEAVAAHVDLRVSSIVDVLPPMSAPLGEALRCPVAIGATRRRGGSHGFEAGGCR
ncbi:MAG: pilus assembly protein PilM [Eggerthellaceae bacterium]